jgi:hypothetical protein
MLTLFFVNDTGTVVQANVHTTYVARKQEQKRKAAKKAMGTSALDRSRGGNKRRTPEEEDTNTTTNTASSEPEQKKQRTKGKQKLTGSKQVTPQQAKQYSPRNRPLRKAAGQPAKLLESSSSSTSSSTHTPRRSKRDKIPTQKVIENSEQA